MYLQIKFCIIIKLHTHWLVSSILCGRFIYKILSTTGRQSNKDSELMQIRGHTFWRPGNLNLALLRASMTDPWWFSRARTDMMGCPMCTRATVPWGFPKAPLIPVWSLQNDKKHCKKIPRSQQHRIDFITDCCSCGGPIQYTMQHALKKANTAHWYDSNRDPNKTQIKHG